MTATPVQVTVTLVLCAGIKGVGRSVLHTCFAISVSEERGYRPYRGGPSIPSLFSDPVRRTDVGHGIAPITINGVLVIATR